VVASEQSMTFQFIAEDGAVVDMFELGQ